jgi:adenylate kinase
MGAPAQLILLGPPGAGKGTQAARLAQRLGLVPISPGQILRERTSCDSVEGRCIGELISAGELVPDELINRLVRERIESLSPEQGFLLDGYPRTPGEARFLRRTLVRMNRADPRPLAIWLTAPPRGADRPSKSARA